MLKTDEEHQLLIRLRTSFAEDPRGFTAERDGQSGVLVLNRGHYRGVWRWVDGNYSFTPGGYGSSTHTAATSQDAVRFTNDRFGVAVHCAAGRGGSVCEILRAAGAEDVRP